MSAATQVCSDCSATFAGTRVEARRAGWEPSSTRTEQGIDRGPLVCPACVDGALAGLLEALPSPSGRA